MSSPGRYCALVRRALASRRFGMVGFLSAGGELRNCWLMMLMIVGGYIIKCHGDDHFQWICTIGKPPLFIVKFSMVYYGLLWFTMVYYGLLLFIVVYYCLLLFGT